MNAVTCVTWIKRGVAKEHPDTIRLDAEELSKLIKSSVKQKTSDSDDEEKEDEEKAGNSANESNMDTLESKYNLDHYDDDESDDGDNGVLSMAGLSFYDMNQQDPYLKKEMDSEDESEETIRPDDNLIALGKVHGDYFSLEIWVSNATDGSLYCHHDAVLSNCPLAIEWVGFDSGDENPLSGNLVAIGSMASDIELWDVDVVNTLEPAFVLKGEHKKKTKRSDGSKKVKRSGGHSDSVLGLSWNRNRQSVLASASADESVAVWDLMTGEVVSFFRGHSDKVQTVEWHPVEDHLLLSGSYDGSVRLFDCRAPPGEPCRSWSLGGEVEKVLWNHHDPFCAFAGTDSGLLACIDMRQTSIKYTFSAHTAALTSIALSPSITNSLATASNDRSFKVWDIENASEESLPTLVAQRMCKIGAVHCAAACPEEPMMICIGGEREMKVINMQRDSRFTDRFNCKVETSDENVATLSSAETSAVRRVKTQAKADVKTEVDTEVKIETSEEVHSFAATAKPQWVKKPKKKSKHSKPKKH